jgi:uncharacterized protein (TIGR00299 family) protein
MRLSTSAIITPLPRVGHSNKALRARYPSRRKAIRPADLETHVHLHLDLVGGISGDMFIGAMLDTFPDLAQTLPPSIDAAGFRDLVTLGQEPADDGILTGTHFTVTAASGAEGHDHRHYSQIVKILNESDLSAQARDCAQAIFRLLAEAEAKVHGKAIADVVFHEVGAWDSIADVVCAATLITELGDCTYSCSRLPLGGGRVKTAHGPLPVPAPAVSLLLEGFEFFDDGIAGERITPTGAAILKFLTPTTSPANNTGRLTHTGFGFGTKRFPGISNVLRVLVFELASSPTTHNNSPSTAWDEDQVLVLEFEVDDQPSEELARGLDQVRADPDVLDILQTPGMGKKNRLVSAIRVLARPAGEERVVEACFRQSTTLGIRSHLSKRSILRRHDHALHDGGSRYRVKLAERPGSVTAKAELDDIPDLTQIERRRLRDRLADAAIDATVIDTAATDQTPIDPSPT